MTSEVGSGQVAIFPTFRGFRSQVASETTSAGREGGKSFNSAFNVGAGDPGAALVKKLNAQVASGAKAMSTARLAEQDAAGKVRVAEAALNEAREKGGAATSRSIAAEERLEAAKRKLIEAQNRTRTSTDQVRDAQARLADATSAAGASGEQAATRYERGWKGLRQRLTGTVRGAVDEAGDAAKSSADKGGRTSGGAFGTAFKGAMGALAGLFAVDAIVGGFKSALKGAGDLQQSAGAIQSVFKESSGDMLRWSADADKAVGLTQNEFNELGTLIGAQLKNGGTAMDQLAPKTNELIGLGADLSSMFGGTSKEAIEALSSALKGERDPIEKYGVSLNQAKIDAEAMAMGAEKVDGAFSNQAQQAATLSLIMKQTSDAQGNFAKESDTLAGQQQRASAGWKDISDSIGGIFLPIMTSAFGFLNSNILPVIDSFVSRLGDEGLGGAFAPLAAVAGPILATLAAQFGPLIPQVLSLVSAFSPLGLILGIITPLLPEISAMVQTLTGTLAGVLSAVLPLVTALVAQLAPIIVQLIATVLPPLVAVFGELITAIQPFVSMLLAEMIPVIQSLMPVITTVFGIIAEVITAAMQIVQGIIQVVTGLISGDWSLVWEGISNIFGGIWAAIVAVVTGAIGLVGSIIGGGLNAVFGFVGSILGSIGTFFADTWNNVINGVGGFITGIVQFFIDLPGQIMSALGNLGNFLLDAGRALIQGFIDGISGMVGAIGDAVGGVLDFAKSFFPHSPAKRGPFSGSGYTSHSGKALADDFAKGIEGEQSRVATAASRIMTAASLTGTVDTTSGAAVGTGNWQRSGANVQVTMPVTERVHPDDLARSLKNTLNYELRMA